MVSLLKKIFIFFCNFLISRNIGYKTTSLWLEKSLSKVICPCEGGLFSLRTNGFMKESNSKTNNKKNWAGKHLTRNTNRRAEAALNPSNHSTWIRVPSEGAESGLFIDENEWLREGLSLKCTKQKYIFLLQPAVCSKSVEGKDPCVQSNGRRKQLLLRRQGYTCKVTLVVRPQQLSCWSDSFTQRVHLDSQSLLQTPQCALKEMCGNELWKFLMGNLVH